MIFDSLGLPKDIGATDFQDSARLAGIMTVFEWPQKVNIFQYIGYFNYLRHPRENRYDMSRDQAVCLVAGIYKQGGMYEVRRDLINGKDILSPSVLGHIRRCQGRKATWLQDQWLKLDIMWAAYVKPEDEINQLLCMIMIAGPSWVQLFKKHHKNWKANLRAYWCGWRGEPELCEWIIGKVEAHE
jgi:hypothetical protein